MKKLSWSTKYAITLSLKSIHMQFELTNIHPTISYSNVGQLVEDGLVLDKHITTFLLW